MKMKYLIIVSLILAILTIGAASATDDVAADDELAVDEGVEIEEAPVDDVNEDSEVLEESADIEEPVGDYSPQDFNLVINTTMDVDDEYASAITFSAPNDANGEIEVNVYDGENSHDVSFDLWENKITLENLEIYSAGTYLVDVTYYDDNTGDSINLGSGTIIVSKAYTQEDFSISWGKDIDYSLDALVNVWNYPVEGTLQVYVNGNPRFTKKIDDLSDDIYVYVSDVGITQNGEYTISAKYAIDSTNVIDLGQAQVNVNIDWNDDEYVDVSTSLDILYRGDSLVTVDSYEYIEGTISIYIDGSLKLSKKISASEKKDYVYFTVEDLGLYNNAAIGKHTVKAVYMKNDVELHFVERSVEFYAEPTFDSYYSMSVGEKETFVVTSIKGFQGTATLYNAVGEYGDEKGTLFKSATFVNGVASIPLDSLSKGEHRFILNVTGMNYEPPIHVEVIENTPGYSSSVSASEILVGNNIVLTFNANQVSSEKVYIEVDGNEYKSVKVTATVLSETIQGLSVGTHKIKVIFWDGDKFYSNTFHVTVKNKVTPSAPPATKVTKKATKITAKKATFKAKKKVKKYTITLKAGKTAVKGVKVTLKVGKKTYKAKTNAKGKATFKITKLTKKGKYTAVIKFAGNKNYKATSKKVKITVKK